MTFPEAKQVLLLYRPGTADAQDPEVAAALALVKQDPELRRWFDQHCAFQQAMRRKVRQIAPPPGLKARILGAHKVIRSRVWWQNPVWLAAAAAVVLLATLALFWLRPRVPDQFADYQHRMVGAALRDYRMDVVTNNMEVVRRVLSEKGAPADYAVPPRLQQLALTGGGALRWRSNPVAMVCFERSTNQMMYLFVIHRSALKDPPPAAPRVAKVNKLMTASWTQGDNSYVLAGPEDPEFLQKFL
jgi:uncharacterized membrane protein YbaN (DUF454 family)